MPETQLETGTIKPDTGTDVLESSSTEQVPVVDNTPEVKKPDIIQRVSAYVQENEQNVQKNEQTDDGVPFDSNKIDAITTTEGYKAYDDERRKEYDRVYGKKFQELADLRKSLEANQGNNGAWTPERIKAEMNKPDFIHSAQEVANSQTSETEDYSALSDTEKHRIMSMENELKALRQTANTASRIQQDEHLKSRYSNYDSNAVDLLTADLLEGKVQATRESLWKVRDYDHAVNRAYELGRQDERSGVNEKVESVAAEGIAISRSEESVKKEEGETDQSLWNRLANKNLARLAKVTQFKKQ